MKTWYQSKTMWLNLIAVIALIVQTQFGFVIDAETQAGILAVINLVLRAFTSTGLTMGNSDQPDNSGFAALRLLQTLTLVILASAMLFAAGCASTGTNTSPISTPPTSTDTPIQLAGKSLLTVKATITTAAKATDALCNAGKIGSDKCTQAKDAYNLSKPAYDSAVDAYLLMVQGGDPAKFGESLQRVQNIATRLLLLAESSK